jgi:hypothetical protein
MDFERRCQALWNHACQLAVVSSGCEARIHQLASDKGLQPLAVTQKNIGRFKRLDALVVETADGNVALPLSTPNEILKTAGGVDRRREFWADLGWFHPAYIARGEVAKVVKSVQAVEPAQREDLLQTELGVVYTPGHIASMLVDRYPQLSWLALHIETIRESVEVFFCGYRRVAIAGLLPVVEGVLQRMLNTVRTEGGVTGAELLSQVISTECERATERLVYHRTWIPQEYRERAFLEAFDEYIRMLGIFDTFGRTHLFANTSTVVDPSKLNRHGILHGKFTEFGRDSNFFRLWSILDMLAFMMTLSTSGVSVFVPELTAESAAFACRLEYVRNMRQTGHA